MSLPSISAILAERNITDVTTLAASEHRNILLVAMKRDLPIACEYLHRKAHEADGAGGAVNWDENPNSELGRQLIRIHASDAMRPIAETELCHGKKLTFVNCCNGTVGTPPENVFLTQIQTQNGDRAKPDC